MKKITISVTLLVMVILLTNGCSKSNGSSGPIGRFQGGGTNFTEEIILTPAGAGLEFKHIVVSGGLKLCDESGSALISGSEIRLNDFTEYVDSESGGLHSTPKKFVSTGYYFLDGAFEMLKPFPEHDYFLKKILPSVEIKQ